MTKPFSQGTHSSQGLTMEDRRRSQRVVISVPVTLYYASDGGKFNVQASTVSVNDHGAMLLCQRTFASDGVIELQNNRTHEKQQCRVTRTPSKSSQGYLVPVEFSGAAPDFWRISFPPTNWKPTEE